MAAGPGVKEPQQLLAELDDMRRVGFHSAFIVDDNFIGNKQKAKALLKNSSAGWSSTTFPCSLITEASIDLAGRCRTAGPDVSGEFRSVFIGIETPRRAGLQESKKLQNLRGDPCRPSSPGSKTPARHQRRLHRRVRQRRPDDFRGPVPVHPGQRDHSGHGRNAAGHSPHALCTNGWSASSV